MSVRLMTAVWDHFPGSGTQLLTMLKLADYADDAGENVFPSVATIAKYVRSTKRQVQRIMHGLIADNWIEVVAHANGGRGRAREYRLRIDRLNVPEKDDTNVTLSPIKGDAHVALSTKRVTSKVKKGDTHVTPSIKNQKIKHIRRQPEGVATSSIPEIHTCPAEQIVALYHEILPELPKVKVLTDKRRKHLRARWCSDYRYQNLDWWRKFFHAVHASDWLMGRTGGPWAADFEWLIEPDHFARVIEGRYANRQGGNGR